MCDRNKLLNMPVNNDSFAGKNEINIVFIGGSITEGSGSSAIENCYVNLTSEWF